MKANNLAYEKAEVMLPEGLCSYFKDLPLYTQFQVYAMILYAPQLKNMMSFDQAAKILHCTHTELFDIYGNLMISRLHVSTCGEYIEDVEETNLNFLGVYDEK